MKTKYCQFFILFLIGPSLLKAQMNQYLGQNQNYVVTHKVQIPGVAAQTMIDSLNVESLNLTIQYFDGLGRPIQTVNTQGSPDKKDIVQPVVYDQYGRQPIQYLPYVSLGTDGWLRSDPIAEQSGFYSNSPKVASSTNPYAKTIFEPSPLNRVLEQGAPGESWQPDNTDDYNNPIDRTIKKAYEFNTANEVLLWSYTPPDASHPFGQISCGPPGAPNYYGVNQLYKNKTKDEEHHEVIEYIDKQGRTILKRVQAVNGTPSSSDANKDVSFASTYYIYDVFGNLVVVLPPEGVKELLNIIIQN